MRKYSLILLALCMFAVGCQPTPEQQIVVQKNTQRMIEAASETEHIAEDGSATSVQSLHNRYGIPESYQKELHGAQGNLTISMDARVHIPQSNALPVARVEAANFQQEFIDTLVATLFEGNELYHPPKELTKSRIEHLIFDAQIELKNEDLHAETRSSLEAQILQWQEMLLTAPEDLAPEHATTQLQGRSLRITSQANGGGMSLAVQNDEDAHMLEPQEIVQQESGIAYDVYTRQATIEYVRDEMVSTKLPRIIRGASLVADVTNEALSGNNIAENILTLSPQEAKAKADAFLKAIDLHDMAVTKVWLISNHLPKDILELMVDREALASLEDYYSQTPQVQAYEIHCSRVVQGVQVTSDTFFHSRSAANDDFYSREWFYEEMLLYLDEQGVAMFRWSAPLSVNEIVVQNSQMQPFDTIVEIFEKMMMVQYEPQFKGSEANKATIEVTKAVLSLQRISEQNSVSEGLLIPTWNFYGRLTTFLPDGTSTSNDAYGPVPLMTINAIDGSIIDPWNGY
ncbi:DUF6034 family protein [Eubacteriales bacterium OttesenSCG-928-K08]|nr:DUF6034 family protein [Eubacteriales bacterium OttesenSCG-928-K08]